MSFDPLPEVEPLEWMGEENCGLPPARVEGPNALVKMVPVVGTYMQSSATTRVGKAIEAALGFGGSFVLSKLTGGAFAATHIGTILHEALGPYIGEGAAKLAEKAAEKGFDKGVDEGTKRGAKAARQDFSPKAAVGTLARAAAMAAEKAVMDTGAGQARFRMQAAMGEHGRLGSAMHGGKPGGSGDNQ